MKHHTRESERGHAPVTHLQKIQVTNVYETLTRQCRAVTGAQLLDGAAVDLVPNHDARLTAVSRPLQVHGCRFMDSIYLHYPNGLDRTRLLQVRDPRRVPCGGCAMGQVAFQELGARALHRFHICVSGGLAMIQPGQEFQLREQVIGCRAAVDLQAEGR